MIPSFLELHAVVACLCLALAVPAFSQGPAAPPAGLSPLDQPQQQTSPAPTNALDKKDLEFYIRHLYLWGPHIKVEIGDFTPSPIEGLLQTTIRASFQLASQQRVMYVSKDGQQVFEGRAFPIAKHPFQSNLEKIKTADRPALGTAGAPVVIAVYSDFQCPYCAKEAQLIRGQLLQAYPKDVRVYFRDFPLDSHNWALDAAVIGQCMHRLEPAVFWDYHDWIFANQSSTTPQNLKDKTAEFAAGKGIDAIKLSQCVESRETEPLVRQSIEEGRSVGVTSTPTIFVNGRPLAGSMQWEQLKQVIDYELEYQKITHNAGDDCGCEVEVPFPGQD
jgi:protein-disulfide isomerase